jgi:hypothetical protein
MQVRQLYLDKLIWTAAGQHCLGPTYTPQPRPPACASHYLNACLSVGSLAFLTFAAIVAGLEA